MNIFEAIREGNFLKIQEILKQNKSAVNAVCSVGKTPLHWAVEKQPINWVIIELLLKYNANINAKDLSRQSPLSILPELKKTIEIVYNNKKKKETAKIETKQAKNNNPQYASLNELSYNTSDKSTDGNVNSLNHVNWNDFHPETRVQEKPVKGSSKKYSLSANTNEAKKSSTENKNEDWGNDQLDQLEIVFKEKLYDLEYGAFNQIFAKNANTQSASITVFLLLMLVIIMC